MATYVAVLPGINHNGRSAKMADLRTELAHKGFVEVESYSRNGPLRLSSSRPLLPTSSSPSSRRLRKSAGSR
jgi:uncharacterized protein (DUF1697 family)